MGEENGYWESSGYLFMGNKFMLKKNRSKVETKWMPSYILYIFCDNKKLKWNGVKVDVGGVLHIGVLDEIFFFKPFG